MSIGRLGSSGQALRGFLLPNFTLRRKYDKLTLMVLLTRNQVFEIIGRLEAEIRALGVSRIAS